MISLATIKGLLLSLQSTSSLWDVFLLYITKKPRKITFRKGLQDTLTWHQYRLFRNVLLSDYLVTSIPTPPSYQSNECLPLYMVEKGSLRLILNTRSMDILFESLVDDYGIFNIRGKTILDIGGYCGDTAVIFWNMGAKHIEIYEPMPENIALAKVNCELNSVDYTLNEYAVSSSDGTVTVHYGELSVGLSIHGGGQKEIAVKTKSISDIIQNSGAYLAKFDCEGGESHLLGVDEKILRMIPKYIVECHSDSIKESLKNKFMQSGFRLHSELVKQKGISIVSFELQDDASPTPRSS